AILKVLDLASMIVVVTNPDILVLNQTKKVVDKLQTLLYPPEMTKIVLNKMSSQSPYTPRFIEQTLKRQVISVVPEDIQSASNALAKGSPLIISAPQSPTSKALFALSRLLIERRVLEQLQALNRPSRPVPK